MLTAIYIVVSLVCNLWFLAYYDFGLLSCLCIASSFAGLLRLEVSTQVYLETVFLDGRPDGQTFRDGMLHFAEWSIGTGLGLT